MYRNVNNYFIYYINIYVLNFSGEEPKTILQYYKKSFTGFVANLTKEEANKMAVCEIFFFLWKHY